MKIQKIETTSIRKVGKVVLWLLIFLLIFLGVKSILSQSSEDELKQIIANYKTETEKMNEIRTGAAAFAESFIYDYYTFSGEMNSDYESRVKRYLAKGLDIKAPQSGVTAAEAISVQTIHVQLDENGTNKADVDVLAKVKYEPLGSTEAAISTEKDIYVRVPVAMDKKIRYAIESLPMIIPKHDVADIKQGEGYSGTDVGTASKAKIKTVLESFFKAYYEGTDSEVSYYVTSDSNIRKSLGGLFKFDRINTLYVTSDELTEEYRAEVMLTVLDNGQPLQQRLFIRLEEAKDKFYINKIYTRAI